MNAKAKGAKAARRSALVVVICLAGGWTNLSAAVFTVDNTDDSGPGTLRQAIIDANASTGPHTISCTNLSGTITLSSPLPRLTRNITLAGPGANLLTVSGSNAFRVFQVAGGSSSSISGLTIANGYVTNDGGAGILNAGSLRLQHCVVSSNRSDFTRGGGIVNQGTMAVENCTITSNTVHGFRSGPTSYGGGISLDSGSIVISNSTLSRNLAYGGLDAGWQIWGNGGDGIGGGLFGLQGTATIINSTIYENRAHGSVDYNSAVRTGGSGRDGLGGGLYFASNCTAYLINCTLSKNRAEGGDGMSGIAYGGDGGNGRGGGIYSASSNIFLVNCTVILNTAAGGAGGANSDPTPPYHPGYPGSGFADGVYGSGYGWIGWIVSRNSILQSTVGNFEDQGHNLISVGASLGLLEWNGGPTLTHALQPGSPAIDAGTAEGAPAFDQRGVSRPQGGAVDIGAYELISGPPQALILEPNVETVIGTTFSLTAMAVGIAPFVYQWRKNGVALLGATNASLTISNATHAREGEYTVVVTDRFGTGTSPPFQVILRLPIAMTTAGGGMVSAFPNQAGYTNGQSVTVSATPLPGWRFLQWLGDLTGTNASESLIVNRPRCVQAVFGTALNLSVSGSGSVVVDPVVESHPYGTIVRLTAVPTAGNYLGVWGNMAKGIDNPLLFTVTNASPTVSCLFLPLPTFQSALTVIASGQGRVMLDPSSNRYPTYLTVTLTAVADKDRDFLGWTGDASGTQTNLAIRIDQSKMIGAEFTTRPKLRIGPCCGETPADEFRFILSGQFGSRYQIEESTSLTNWIPRGVVATPFGETQLNDAYFTNGLNHFYRALSVP